MKNIIKSTFDFEQLHKAVVSSILQGKGVTAKDQRQAAFENVNFQEPLKTLVDKVAKNAYKVTDSDIDAVKKSGFSEDQIFEFIICAAVGQASRQYANALAILTEVTPGNEGSGYAS
ncbi:MAG: hypothetical protein WKF87_20930 [Chryseolinea sp.]